VAAGIVRLLVAGALRGLCSGTKEDILFVKVPVAIIQPKCTIMATVVRVHVFDIWLSLREEPLGMVIAANAKI
jgi:hypothetical protein